MGIETIQEHRCFGGLQGFYRHDSRETGTQMRFSVFVPPGLEGKAPVLYFLSGLTCSEQNFTTKAGFQRHAVEHGLVVVAPDTSPRGDVPDDPSWDLGVGAGFYVDAVEQPWARFYRMYSYVTSELPALVAAEFPVDAGRQGITGHSMGGHGALVIGLRNPQTFKSVSALAPIAAPTLVPWGIKAFSSYLGDDRSLWSAYDACALLRAGHEQGPILVDQGLSDNFLETQLKPEELELAAEDVGQELELRMHEGYDHSYFFIATFIGDHLAHHAKLLG